MVRVIPVMIFGKSDNAKPETKIEIGDIIRVASEEVIKKEIDGVVRYSGYISRFLEPIPEKSVTDTLDVFEKLSMFQPKRPSVEEIARWKTTKKQQTERISPVLLPPFQTPKREDIVCFRCPVCKNIVVCGYRLEGKELMQVCPFCGHLGLVKVSKEEKLKSLRSDVEVSKKEGRIPDDIYEKYAVENKPLPKEFYKDYRESKVAFAQFHIRGILPEDADKFKSGKISVAEMVEGHSLHCDLRIDFGFEKLIQWVITDNEPASYIRTFKGETDPKTGNVQKSKVIVKPSALLEPEEKKKSQEETLALDKEGAKIVEKYDIKKGSYLIEPGDVGATAKTYAYMELIWEGKVKAGVQRQDLHEYFMYPNDDLPSLNKELFNGRFIIRCFKFKDGNTWMIFKGSGGTQ